MEQDFPFDEWFDIFVDKTKRLKYEGPIDKYSFEWNWESGETPEQAADDFVKAMNEE